MMGCATLATLAFPGRIEEEMYNKPNQLQSLPRVYSGTIADAYCVSQFAEPILLCLIDLPLSIAADTLTRAIGRALWMAETAGGHASYRETFRL